MLELLPLDPRKDGVASAQVRATAEPAPVPRAENSPALQLADSPALHADNRPAPVARNPPAAEPSGADRFLTIATSEFERGNVDAMLWDRAMARAQDDRDAAIAIYLRARATILQVLDRDKKEVRRSRASAATDDVRHPAIHPGSDEDKIPTALASRRGTFSQRSVLAAVVVCVGLVAGAAVFVVLRGNSPGPVTAAAASAAPAKSATASAQDDNARKSAKVTEVEAAKQSLLELVAKIETLREAGNWNVHVLYAGEWTRKEPGNAAAWNELGIGYEKLRQFDDAYAAASKAVALAPNNGMYWRNLGLLDVEINLPEEALHAFGQAAAANDQDILSVVQVGLLNARLGRMAEARSALERALAANADDANTTCLKALIARPPMLSKVPVAPGKRVEPLDALCRDPGGRTDPSVVATSSAVPVNPPVRAKR